jgi:hypothetical protein
MGIEICPLQSDWGNWADWFNVLAAIGVGVAVGLMTRRTNKLAAAANKTNRKLAKLEKQREHQAAEVEQARRRVMLVSIEPLIRVARAQFSVLYNATIEPAFVQRFANERDYRDNFEGWVRGADLTLADAPIAEAHLLGETLGARLARAARTPRLMLRVLERGHLDHATPEGLAGGAGIVKFEVQDARNDLNLLLDACHDAMRDTGIAVVDG